MYKKIIIFSENFIGDRALILTNLDSPMAIFDFGHLQGVNWSKLTLFTGIIAPNPPKRVQ